MAIYSIKRFLLFFLLCSSLFAVDKDYDTLMEIGKRLFKDPQKKAEALTIFEDLYQKHPQDADVLFFLGTLLIRTDHKKIGETLLLYTLKLSPKYGDAALQLGLLYLAEKCYCKAEKYFNLAIRIDSTQRDPHKGLARTLAALLHYCRSKQEYLIIEKIPPFDITEWNERFDIRSHTDPTILLDSFYTQAKENDPTLDAPVVRDFYTYNALTIRAPICDRYRLDTKIVSYIQKEDDIFPPTGVNYNIPIESINFIAHDFFAKEWKWDLNCRFLYANGIGNEQFPFQRTFRVEPGTLLMYNSEKQIAALDAHIESFIIKNFQHTTSQLLQTDILSGTYLYRFTDDFNPEVEANFTKTFYQDSIHNLSDLASLALRYTLPFYDKLFQIRSRYAYSHYHKLTTNYFSYHLQNLFVLGCKLYHEFCFPFYMEGLYEHSWQITRKFIQPIGSVLNIGNLQSLNEDLYELNFGYRYTDHFRAEIGGHYFRSNLPYREWNIHGSFTYQF